MRRIVLGGAGAIVSWLAEAPIATLFAALFTVTPVLITPTPGAVHTTLEYCPHVPTSLNFVYYFT